MLRHPPADLRGGTLLQHPRVLVATVACQESPHLCLQILRPARFQVFRGACILLRASAVAESQEAQGLLEEIRLQPNVFVLIGPAIVITNVATARCVFLVEGWSTESVSRVVRTAKTRQEKHEKERAEHAYYSHIHDEVTISDVFRSTIPSSDSLQTRRRISKIHEDMGHPSNHTLVRVLRLGGAKRRFILAAAKHSCGACEAQKRPAGPIVSRSPNSFVFNDVVGLDLFFLNTHDKRKVCLP